MSTGIEGDAEIETISDVIDMRRQGEGGNGAETGAAARYMIEEKRTLESKKSQRGTVTNDGSVSAFDPHGVAIKSCSRSLVMVCCYLFTLMLENVLNQFKL